MGDVTEITQGQRLAKAERLTQSLGLSKALSTDLTPASDDRDTRIRFAAALGPCLALTAPAGMNEDDRRTWLNAAFGALRHLPLDLIETGAKQAQLTADHPSKIVPAIITASKDTVAWRQRMNRPLAPEAPALPAPGTERATADEMDAICKRYGVGRYAKTEGTEHAA